PLVDEDNTIFAVLAGHPRDPKWQEDVVDPATKLMEETTQAIYGQPFYGDQKAPHRGPHHAETVGGSMGGGQEYPMNCFQTVFRALLLAQVLATKPFQRLAGFINGMFKSFGPNLHQYYATTMQKLQEYDDGLRFPFDLATSVFAAATFNFGPRTVTLPHLDFANLAWGWCSIVALGNFNPDKGGHLILWDLRLVIRFPPGSCILIPSAILRHSNVSIQQGENRFSFTQFTAAGLFRFVENGFRTEKTANATERSVAEKAERAEQRRLHFTKGVRMYKQWDRAFE
ncbi:hypothetical protein DFH07DRAFT_758924, partial [Mycena maculata]